MELRRSSRRRPAVKTTEAAALPAKPAIARRSRTIREVGKILPKQLAPMVRLRRPCFRGSEQPSTPLAKNSLRRTVDREVVHSCLDTLERMVQQNRGLQEDNTVHELSQQLHHFIQAVDNLAVNDAASDADLLSRIKNEALAPETASPASKADLLLTKILVDEKVSGAQSLAVVAKWHGIDTQDVAEIAFTRENVRPRADRNAQFRLDLQCVNKRVNKLLSQERDSSLMWPEKKKKPLFSSSVSETGDAFSNVALMS
ncbi:LAME_0H07954g1_1 [Lachancea meyersii CBS 8951]|uniref:LAME_0H07954g1_1 n=1 Tax=Lachancea meyersii CBS 8951 TaxID=1266667 RepID=A0A1G4KFC5_9SACH|nr:LAME_0H07954g1_1 [Lachancea meyersii CBS 8951]